MVPVPMFRMRAFKSCFVEVPGGSRDTARAEEEDCFRNIVDLRAAYSAQKWILLEAEVLRDGSCHSTNEINTHDNV